MTYFAAEQLIIQKLQDNISSIKSTSILSAADLDGVIEQSQINPAIHTLLFDDVPVSGQKGRSASHQLVDQFWSVVVVVKNVKDIAGKAARNDAGPIVAEVIELLHNFDPPHPYSKLIRVKAPYRATYRNGFFYFPMMFKTRFSTKGNSNGR